MKTTCKRGGLSAALGLALGLALLPAGQAQAATYVPCNDIPALVGAVNQSNATGASITLATGCTYVLTDPDNGENGLPLITGTVRITSNGATIQRSAGATDDFRIFEVAESGTLSLTSTSVSGGKLTSTDGGGILNSGTLRLASGSVTDNEAGSGGGIYNQEGRLSLNQTTVENNEATDTYGGGIRNDAGTMTMSGGALRNNTAASDGGGLENYPTANATFTGTTVTGNTSGGLGGGIDNYDPSTLRVTSGTISNNQAEFGGGIYNSDSTATLVGARVINNTATGGPGSGGGIYEDGGAVSLTGGEVTGNTPENCAPPGSVPGCIDPPQQGDPVPPPPRPDK
ncbi:hypothetical protein [Streptomyces sp. WMMB 322]|uniref:hypothetical protein n=1 Tax=Streptomyces sp. WMMB 322 TaxID=1286821 RepID=UPI0006E3A6E1|nr:hypothetical protein [Streptomyces sp. WMMB 322]SCK35932.1 hypothetical protein H180DRAFT_02987 [Streptomyces sp. WMMB 322]